MTGDHADARQLLLVLWGDLFEDFHDTIDVSLDRFRTELDGGWLFGYVDALASAGVRTTLLHVSARVDAVERFTHVPTGASVTILPAPRRHRWLRAAYRRSGRRKVLSSLASYASIPIWSLRRELRRSGAEAILTQEYEHARFDVLVTFGRIVRVPVFASFQGGDVPHSRLERSIRPRTIAASAGLIIGSVTERDRVAAVYGVHGDQVADIPNAMDVTPLEHGVKAAARAELGIDEATCVVAWQGRVTLRRKGLDVLLAAWASVCSARPTRSLTLLLVGTGRDAVEFRRRIEASGTSDTIRWRDEYISDRAALLPYQSAADIFVLPSRHEGFPVAPIEAMTLGLPVVATDAPGIADIFASGDRSGGVIVAVDDADALATALGRLIDDPDLRTELGRRARQRVEGRYSFEVVGAQLRAFLFDDRPRHTSIRSATKRRS